MTEKAQDIPAFGFQLRPILCALLAPEISFSDVLKSVADTFNFPPSKINVAAPAGTKNTFHNNFQVALSWLKNSGLVEEVRRPRPGNPKKTYAALSLTPAGKKAWASNTLPPMPDKLANRDLATELRKVPQKKKVARSARGLAPVKRVKRANVLGAEAAIIEGIQRMEHERLHGLWIQNVLRLGDPGQAFKHGAANRIVEAVEQEWKRRLPHIRKHPEYFTWPSTEADGGGDGFEIGKVPSEGMLGYLEYRVGRTNGLPEGARRAILDRVVTGTLPIYWSLEYYEQWSDPGSAARLQKLAETIAAFARNAKRRRRSALSDAIAEWESDLVYLKKKHYLTRFRFGWPSTL
ncbi:MAG: hypothetical protein ABJ360_00565 [Roseobacter sp.]|uniref:hypothetical protein n=1 Tax=Tateyamaria sp. TaxID=1929288 RepID=UPI00326DC686